MASKSGILLRLRRVENVLRLAEPERPVFGANFGEHDHHVFLAHARRSMQPLDNRTIERLLFLDGAAAAEENLNDYVVARAFDAQIMRIHDQIFIAVFGEDLEAVAFGNADGFAQRRVDSVRDGTFVRGKLSFAN